MSCCYVAGTGTGQDGRNQQTVTAGGQAGGGERRDVECGNSAVISMTSADRGFRSSGV
jgi:hypothetical protein